MEIKINTEQLTEVGFDSNVLAGIVEGKLVLVIDVARDLGPSSSGKMRAVASTSGFQGMPNGLKGNVWVGKKP